MRNNFFFLSYILNNDLSCYNGDFNIKIEKFKNNELSVSMNGHCGTHIDLPFHVDANGKNINDYKADDFIFNRVFAKEVLTNENYISPNNLTDIPNDIDFLIIKTGLCKKRFSNEYTYKNVGISLETAKYLRENFKNLKCIGIDSLSINAYNDKESGRLAHKEFLNKNPEILIIEDMDLQEVKDGFLSQVIVAPLRINNSDGASVSILAKV